MSHDMSHDFIFNFWLKPFWLFFADHVILIKPFSDTFLISIFLFEIKNFSCTEHTSTYKYISYHMFRHVRSHLTRISNLWFDQRKLILIQTRFNFSIQQPRKFSKNSLLTVVCLKSGLACVRIFDESRDFLENSSC